MGAAALSASARLIRIQRAVGAIKIRQSLIFNEFYYEIAVVFASHGPAGMPVRK